MCKNGMTLYTSFKFVKNFVSSLSNYNLPPPLPPADADEKESLRAVVDVGSMTHILPTSLRFCLQHSSDPTRGLTQLTARIILIYIMHP